MGKPDISTTMLLAWDEYKSKSAEEAAAAIYARVENTATTITTWYWTSIKTKRWTSLIVRIIAFAFLIAGTALPIIAATQSTPEARLGFTQFAVSFLAVAGLLQVADKVFGWSNGWMRYVTTVTAMENLVRTFELEWGAYLIGKSAPLNESDLKILFELAKGLEQELQRLQAEETGKWASEFNAGIALLDSLIKSQREDAEKKMETLRATITTKQEAVKAEEIANAPGSLEISFEYKTKPLALKISVDGENVEDFTGHSWTLMNVASGAHKLCVELQTQPPERLERVLVVAAGGVTREKIVIPV